MQLSANNLLIASQQMPKQAPAHPKPQAAFSAALKSEQGTAETSFEPLAFKTADAPAQTASTPPASYNTAGKPGSNINIVI
jgi:hypothetical protein